MTDVQLRRRATRLRVEHLEERCVLSANLVPNQLLLTTASGQVQAVKLAEGQSAEEAMAAYRANPDVVAVEQAQEVRIDGSVTPNDSKYSSQYDMPKIGAPDAWGLATGSTKIAVGVIDTGIDYTHPDLYLNVWLNQGELRSGVVDTDGDKLITFRDLNNSSNSAYVSDLNKNGYIDAGDLLADSNWANGVDNDSNGYKDDLIGWDFVNNDNNPYDDNGHGTHVSGTIGAVGDNGVGVAGINWTTQIAALKFLGSDGSGSTAGAVSALNYAVDKGIRITNNSWGGGGYSSAMNTAISNARSAGDIFVAAAGNNASNNDTAANYPSNYNFDNVVAVASTDSADKLSSFSNYGATTVDLAAPGSSILSTTPNNTYSTYSGTSMATPHVAGALALVWSVDTTQTYDKVIGDVLNNVDTLTSLSGKVATGGRLNLYKAVSAVKPDTNGPRVSSAVLNSSTSPSSVRLTFSEAINPNSFTPADITGATGFSAGTTFSVSAVSGSGNKQFDVNFTPQTAAGSYSFKVGPDITDAAGNKMDQNQNNTNGDSGDQYAVSFTVASAPASTTFSSTSSAVAISDFKWSIMTITVSQAISIEDLNVKVNVSHTYDSDLRLVLMAPDGKYIELSDYRGGSGDNYTSTVFDDEASKAISAGAAPFTGSFRPEQALSTFDGYSTKGDWSLYVYDGYRGDSGKINSWSMTVTGTSATVKTLGEEAPAAAPSPSAGALSATSRDVVLSYLLPSQEGASALPQSSAVQARQEASWAADVPQARREAADLVFSEIGNSASAQAGDAGEDVFSIRLE